eukprot:69253-Chlamydomonas_euryale.AAC.1
MDCEQCFEAFEAFSDHVGPSVRLLPPLPPSPAATPTPTPSLHTPLAPLTRDISGVMGLKFERDHRRAHGAARDATKPLEMLTKPLEMLTKPLEMLTKPNKGDPTPRNPFSHLSRPGVAFPRRALSPDFPPPPLGCRMRARAV